MNIDSQLVEGAKKGDSECFSQLYELVQDDLYKYALYALGNAHDAEDVVAETFLEAFRGISKLREADAFKGWIFKILSIRIKRRISRYVKEKNQLQIEDFAADSALRTDGMDSAVIARTDSFAGFDDPFSSGKDDSFFIGTLWIHHQTDFADAALSAWYCQFLNCTAACKN